MTGKWIVALSAGVLLLLGMAIPGWSQYESTPVDSQRSLPTLDLSDVIIIGVEQASKPQGNRLRELPITAPQILPSAVANIREYPQTASGARYSPDTFSPVSPRLLTVWAGGANHRSADASAVLYAKSPTAQGAAHFDWLSQSGAIDWMDRNAGMLRAGGSLQLSRSFQLGFQGRLERRSWRSYGSEYPMPWKRRTKFGEGDILAQWNVFPNTRLDVRIGGSSWSAEECPNDPITKSHQMNVWIGLHGSGRSLGYMIGISGFYINSEDYWDKYRIRIAQAETGLKFQLSSRIAAGGTVAGAYWENAAKETEFRLVPEGYMAFDLLPLFSLRVQGGRAVSYVDIVERWRLNPYLRDDENVWWLNCPIPLTETGFGPWIQEKPGWVGAELNRWMGKRFLVRGWGGWEKIEGYPIFNGAVYGRFYSTPDTVEITKAGLGFQWVPIDEIEIDLSGEWVWGKVTQSTYFSMENYIGVSTQRSGGVPFLEEGSATGTIAVKPLQGWVFTVGGRFHGERPNWDESGNLPSYGTVAAEIRWQILDPFWVALWGDNLTDTRYEAWPGYEGEPFRVGVRLGYMSQ
jgi:hypothetical protein